MGEVQPGVFHNTGRIEGNSVASIMLRQGVLGQGRSHSTSEGADGSQKNEVLYEQQDAVSLNSEIEAQYPENAVRHQHVHSDSDLIEPDADHSQDMSDEEDTFVFEGHDVVELPIAVAETIYKRRTLRKLSLKGNRLRAVPAILGSLSSLYYLNLSDNNFTEVPACVSELKNLEILDMSNNELHELPSFLGTLKNLIGLSLVNNKIEFLPPVIGDLPKLVILELSENPLQLPEELQPSDDVDEEAWIASLRSYITKHRAEVEGLANSNARERAPPITNPKLETAQINLRGSERTRSASESGISLRSSKRMGFVMSRNASDQSYVASLHARGASYDAHTIDPLTTPTVALTGAGSNVTPNTPTAAITADSYLHGRSTSSITSTGVPLDLSTPRSPLARSPYGSPWGSPRPSFTEMESQTSVSNRLSTLAEEHDLDNAETDLDSPVIDTFLKRPVNTNPATPSHDATLHDPSDEYRNPESSSYLFKDSYQEHSASNSATSSLSNRQGSISSASYRRTSDDVADVHRSTTVTTPRSPIYPNSALEKIKEALLEFGEFLLKISNAIPNPLIGLLNEAMELVSQENWFLTLKAFSNLLDKLTLTVTFQKIITRLNKRQQRQFAMTVMYTFPDLEAAWRIIQQSKLSPLGMDTASGSWAQDEQLHTQLNFAIKQTQDVLALLNNVVSKSAVAAADTSIPSPNMANRVRDLSAVCIRCSTATRDVKKVLDRQNSAQVRGMPVSDRRHFWEDVNTFLKSVISILAAIKTALPDMPLLAEKRVGVEVASLTRVAKEIPPLLEQSSYRLTLDTNEHSVSDTSELANSGMSLVDLTGINMLPPPTPLTATLGTAAQALVSPGERAERPGEGYIQYGIRAHSGNEP